MKILCLYHNPCAIELFDWLSKEGHETVLSSKKLNASWCCSQKFDLTVSYTYRYILPQNLLNALAHNVVNIHNSFLPFNRGADPNIWSILDSTPRGITLHYIDEELDHGAIIAQEFVDDIKEGITLKTAYDDLDYAAKEMFKSAFQYYPYWNDMAKLPKGNGTYHSIKDGEKIKKLISSYDMTVKELRTVYKDMKLYDRI